MKRQTIQILIITIGLLSFALFAVAAPPTINERWEEANTIYNTGNYSTAIEKYESIVADGYISDKLFYNLGNAYFRDNNLGHAILNYSKAERLNPSDKDIEYNLAYANSLVKDRIDIVPDFIFNKWIKGLRNSLNSNQWAVISIIAFALTLGCVLLYILSRQNTLRKTGFYSGIVLSLFFIITAIFSFTERKAFLDASHAVIIQSSTIIKSSPDMSGSELFILHEGTIVEMGNTNNDWIEITIADGNKGWVEKTAIESINF